MTPKNTILTGSSWYELFSRGARDWLRHNEKIQETLRNKLPDLISESNVITDSDNYSFSLPLKILNHARFRLNLNNEKCNYSTGQGKCQPGDILVPNKDQSISREIESSNNRNEIQFLVEINIDDIVEWIWEELKLPDFQIKRNFHLNESQLIREGWDKKGIPSRLDRRRTIKEFLKRRTIQSSSKTISTEDLRFRQIIERKNPNTSAVIFFVLDVSASMSTAERKLAKSFFFFILHGIRKKYNKIDIRFIAHTTQAWEFSEYDFFKVSGAGGTGASSAFQLTLDILKNQYDLFQYNRYLFYASDGENFTEDRPAAMNSLKELSSQLNYLGYIETVPGSSRTKESEMNSICTQITNEGSLIGNFILNKQEDIWPAIKHFFMNNSNISEVTL